MDGIKWDGDTWSNVEQQWNGMEWMVIYVHMYLFSKFYKEKFRCKFEFVNNVYNSLIVFWFFDQDFHHYHYVLVICGTTPYSRHTTHTRHIYIYVIVIHLFVYQ